MLPRTLEPEVMDTVEEAVDYDSMDHSSVNRVFVDDFLEAANNSPCLHRLLQQTDAYASVLDVGTGTAQIPIELCSRGNAFRVTAVDLAEEMLKLARENVARANLQSFIEPQRVDAKQMPFADGIFDAVISNSIVHHIPQPLAVFAEMKRLLKPGGLLFLRDLLRPVDVKTLEHVVANYAGDENAHQQQMFRESLHAALTLDEVREILVACSMSPECVQQTTDRHWTVVFASSLPEVD